MNPSFDDFITEHPICKKYTSNGGAIEAFNFLSEDANRIKMVLSSVERKPALLGCKLELEDFLDSLDHPQFNPNDVFVKNTIGRMIATILAPFGYSPVAQVNFAQPKKGRYFGSASRYEMNREALLRVTHSIEKVLISREH